MLNIPTKPMTDFYYYMPTRVYFGCGKLKVLGEMEMPGKKAFLCTYPTTGYITEKVIEQLKRNNCDFCIHGHHHLAGMWDVEGGVVASPGEWIWKPAFLRMEKAG